MGEIFRQVTAEVSPGFIEHFPSEYDIYETLKQICHVACVNLEYMNDVYQLKGQWNMIGQAHQMLADMVAGSHGSRQFSALVKAAEALSNGVELQEQVDVQELNLIDLKQTSHLTNDYSYMSQLPGQIPVSIGNESDIKAHTNSIPENYIGRGMPSASCTDISEAEALTMSNANNMNTHVTDYDILVQAAGSLKAIESTMPSAEPQVESLSGVIPQDAETVIHCQVYVPQEESDSSDDNVDTDQEVSGQCNLQIVTPDLGADANESKQVNVQQSDTVTYTASNPDMKPKQDMPQHYDESSVDSDALEIEDEAQDEESTADKETNTVSEVSCDQCDFVGKSENGLDDHIASKHNSKKAVKCDVCSKVFSNSRYMRRHRLSHSEPQYKCTECGKEYRVMKALKVHMKKHNGSYVKPEFKCQECPKVFSSNYVLECHVKSEHKGIKKSFLCQTCGKSFTTKHTLQQHSNVHNGTRPYQCADCGKSFSYESALRDHKNIHEGTRKFVCEYPQCKKAFRQRSALKMHEKTHKAMKDFVCDECGRGFCQKQALQRHVRAHKGLKPYTCKLCNRTFGDAAIIRRHIKLVHKLNKDIPDWREDIVAVLPSENKEYFVKPSENQNVVLEQTSQQIPAQSSVASSSSFVSHSEATTTRLPPVTTIQGFRHLDAYADHELPLSHSHTLSVSQEQLPPIATSVESQNIVSRYEIHSEIPCSGSQQATSQFSSMAMPGQHEFMLNPSTAVTQYSYTIASSDHSLATEAKPLESHPQVDNSKIIHLTAEESASRLEMEKPDQHQIQYLDDSLDQRWRKYIEENPHAVHALHEQQKVCNTVESEVVEGKDLSGNVKTLEADVHESLLYPYYNSNLPGGGHYTMSLGHFTTGTLQTTETTGGDGHVQ